MKLSVNSPNYQTTQTAQKRKPKQQSFRAVLVKDLPKLPDWIVKDLAIPFGATNIKSLYTKVETGGPSAFSIESVGVNIRLTDSKINGYNVLRDAHRDEFLRAEEKFEAYLTKERGAPLGGEQKHAFGWNDIDNRPEPFFVVTAAKGKQETNFIPQGKLWDGIFTKNLNNHRQRIAEQIKNGR